MRTWTPFVLVASPPPSPPVVTSLGTLGLLRTDAATWAVEGGEERVGRPEETVREGVITPRILAIGATHAWNQEGMMRRPPIVTIVSVSPSLNMMSWLVASGPAVAVMPMMAVVGMLAVPMPMRGLTMMALRAVVAVTRMSMMVSVVVPRLPRFPAPSPIPPPRTGVERVRLARGRKGTRAGNQDAGEETEERQQQKRRPDCGVHHDHGRRFNGLEVSPGCHGRRVDGVPAWHPHVRRNIVPCVAVSTIVHHSLIHHGPCRHRHATAYMNNMVYDKHGYEQGRYHGLSLVRRLRFAIIVVQLFRRLLPAERHGGTWRRAATSTIVIRGSRWPPSRGHPRRRAGLARNAALLYIAAKVRGQPRPGAPSEKAISGVAHHTDSGVNSHWMMTVRDVGRWIRDLPRDGGVNSVH